MKKITWLIAVLVCCNNLFAQHKFRLFGYVTDADKRPVELASVAVFGKPVGTVTSKSGFYELVLEAKDSLTLVYSCVGYGTVTKKIPPLDKIAQLNISLTAVSTELNSVEVKAYRLRSTTTETLDPALVRRLPDATGGSIESLIATLPGVHTNNELSSQYSVRGGSYDENSVYVNGIEVYRPLLIRAGQQEGLSFINPDLVQSVAFSAGGFAPRYADKMASVLDITYKQPASFEGAVSASLLGASAYVGSASKRFTQIHGIRYKTNSYLLGSLDTKGDFKPAFFDYQTYLTYRLSPKWLLSFLGNVSQNTYRFIPQEQETSFGTLDTPLHLTAYFDGQEKDVFRTRFGAMTLAFSPSAGLKSDLTVSAFDTDEDETYDITGQYWLYEMMPDGSGGAQQGNTLGVGTYHQHARNKLKADVLSVSHSGSYRFDGHQLEWGVAWQHERITNKMKEWEYRDSAGYSLPYNPVMMQVYYNLAANLNLSSERGTGYVQDTYKFRTERGLWSLSGGVRANYWSYNGQLLVSPRFTVAYFPRGSNLSLRFSTGVYYQAPFYKELRDTTTVGGNTIAVLNKGIKAQRSLHFVLGADYHFTKWERPFKFTSELYYKPATDVVPYVVDNVKITYFDGNAAKAYSAGLDMKLFGEFVPGTDSWVGLSLMQSKETIRRGTDSDGNPVYTGYFSRPNEQRYAVTLFFQDYMPGNDRLKVNLKLIWGDGLPVSSPHNPYTVAFRTPSYRRVDLGASYALLDSRNRPENGIFSAFKAVWLNLDVFNLFDINNVNSYFWLSDIYNRQYPIPNYLTGRLLNFRISADF
jgi:hypothetical protein